jgi:hypothetical protein
MGAEAKCLAKDFVAAWSCVTRDAVAGREVGAQRPEVQAAVKIARTNPCGALSILKQGLTRVGL